MEVITITCMGSQNTKNVTKSSSLFQLSETFCWWCFCFLECYSEVPIGQSNGAMLILTYLAMLSAVMNEKPNWVLSETQYILCSHSVGVAPVTVPIGMVRWQYTHTCTDLTVISPYTWVTWLANKFSSSTTSCLLSHRTKRFTYFEPICTLQMVNLCPHII